MSEPARTAAQRAEAVQRQRRDRQRNWGRGRRGQTLAVVEVKARPDRAAAAEAVSARQRQRILAALGWYLARHPERAQDRIRFDAILIVPGRLPQHLEGCWQTSHTG